MVREGQSGCVGKSKILRAGAAPAYETDGDAALNLHDRHNGDRAGTRTERKSKRAKGVGKLTLVPIGALRADPRNPRKHSRIQVRAIARSIDAFGFNAPILVDKRNQIVAGHGRYEAAVLLGLETIPVIRLDHLTEAQARAYLLADNKLAERSSWDDASLALQLKELSELALDFDFEAIGFELPEVDLRIQSLDPTDNADRADEFRNAIGPAVSLPGDLWVLGKHRVYCGSALDPLAYELLMAKERASAVFADPPYNVKIDGNVCGSGAVKHREFAMASGEMTREEFARFLAGAFDLARAYASPGAIIYACMDWRHMAEMLAAGDSANFELLNLCVWVKTNGGMGSLYRSRHELVFVFRNGGDSSSQQRSTRQVRPKSDQRLELPRRQHFQAKRAQERSRLASNRQTNRHGRRRDSGFNQSRRPHPRPLPRQRYDLARRRTGAQAMPWRRTRPALRRYGHRTLGALDPATSAPDFGPVVR